MVIPQLFVKVVSSGEQLQVKGINEAFDGVVDVGGSGTFETIQAADDALDSGAYALWVKTGTYSAGFTVSTNNAYIFVEPGTVIEAAITLSGNNITLVLGAGCDIQGIITLSGANCSLTCQNGVDTDGLVMSGAFGFHDGGGWETIHQGGTANDAIAISGTDCVVQHCAAQTTTGGGNSFEGVAYSAARISIIAVKVIDSDNEGIQGQPGGNDIYIAGCVILGADGNGMTIQGARARVIGNYIIAAGADGINLAASADDSTVIGNIVRDQGAQPIDIDVNGENCVVVGNRVDGAVSDNSGTSTVASNDETAF